MESKKIYYSKFKTTALFYTSGEHIIEIFENNTISLINPNGTQYTYQVLTADYVRNDLVYAIQHGSKIGYFKMMPYGKAELQLGGGQIIKLKI